MAIWLVLAAAMVDSLLDAGQAPVALAPCPASPNCVSSLAEDGRHRVNPFPVLESADQSLAHLVRIVEALPRTRIIQQGTLYLKAEFRTRLGFVDDVEFAVDPTGRTIHVRSASRIGYHDFGVNRRRVETLRKLYLADEAP